LNELYAPFLTSIQFIQARYAIYLRAFRESLLDAFNAEIAT